MRPQASYSCRAQGAPHALCQSARPLRSIPSRRAVCWRGVDSCAQSGRHAAVQVRAQRQQEGQEQQHSLNRESDATSARALAVPAPLELLWAQLAQLLGLSSKRYRFQVYNSQASSPPAAAAPPVAEAVRDAVVSAAEVAARAPSIAAAAASTAAAAGGGQALHDVNRWARCAFWEATASCASRQGTCWPLCVLEPDSSTCCFVCILQDWQACPAADGPERVRVSCYRSSGHVPIHVASPSGAATTLYHHLLALSSCSLPQSSQTTLIPLNPHLNAAGT